MTARPIDAIAAFVAVDIALAALVGWQAWPGDRAAWQPPAPIAPALDAPAAPVRPWQAPSSYTETLQRPLFTASRRPAAPSTAPAVAAAPDPLATLRIVGLWGEGRRGGAMVQDGETTRRLRPGERIGGWTVTGVDARGLVLRSPDGRERTAAMPRVVLAGTAGPGGAPRPPSAQAQRAPQPATGAPLFAGMPDDTAEDR